MGINLPQLPSSSQGSVYILVCVDRFSRFVVLALLPNKSAATVAHPLVSHLICQYTTPRLLSDNGTEFKNQVLAEIFSQYSIKQTCITAHHSASNGLVERTNRKILEILCHFAGNLHLSLEDWFSQVAASINGSVLSFTEKHLTTSFLGMTKDSHMTYFCNLPPLCMIVMTVLN